MLQIIQIGTGLDGYFLKAEIKIDSISNAQETENGHEIFRETLYGFQIKKWRLILSFLMCLYDSILSMVLKFGWQTWYESPPIGLPHLQVHLTVTPSTKDSPMPSAWTCCLQIILKLIYVALHCYLRSWVLQDSRTHKESNQSKITFNIIQSQHLCYQINMDQNLGNITTTYSTFLSIVVYKKWN